MSDANKTEPAEPKSIGKVVVDAFHELGQTLKAFIKAPRALWGINIPYIVEGLAYFGGLTILGKYCSENCGLNDVVSGYIYSGVTGGITLAMLLFGGIADKIGVRWSLVISLGAMAIGRGVVALSGTVEMENGLWSPMFFTMCAGLFIMMIHYGLYQPAAYAGVKRYTNPGTAAMGYAVIYALMNLGGFIFGGLSPLVRNTVGEHFPPNGLAAVWWAIAILTVVSTLVTFFLITRKVDQDAVDRVKRETEEINREKAKKGKGDESSESEDTESEGKTGLQIAPEKVFNNLLFILFLLLALGSLVCFIMSMNDTLSTAAGPVAAENGAAAGETTATPWDVYDIGSLVALIFFGVAAIWEFLRQRPDHPFRDKRFVFFIFILIPVQTLFAHQWLTLPYYCDRAFSGSAVSEYFEFFSNLNPILIFVLAPLVAGLTARANIYKMMIIGTTVMAAPTFFLVLGPNMYTLLTYIVLMSIGEAMWQPRFLQWIAEIAPEGKTGAYMGIGQLPWFLTKVVTGFYSGWFIANYCPIDPTGASQNTEFMWLVYGLIAMASPIALILAKKWMQDMKMKTS